MPKYQSIAQWIKKEIKANNFKVGEKLISEHQICDRFSVSRQTARQAVSVLEDEGLVTRKRGSGTYINPVIPAKKTATKNIGLITTYLDDYIFPLIISGVEKVLSDNQYHMTLRLTRNKVRNERAQLKSLLDSDIDGLIVEGTKTALPNPNLDVYQEFFDRGIPVMFINAYYGELDCNYVVSGDAQGARLATRRLIDAGHSKIAGIFKHDDQQGNFRYKGFMEEMYQQGLEIDEQAVIWYSTESHKELFSPQQLPLLLQKLKNCTAVICYNDQIAMKLIQLFNPTDLKIPQDLALVSFDNSSLCDISTVPLTSVTHPGTTLGETAAHSILTMIENPHYKIQQVIEPELVERASVAAR
ncbi:MAG: GntR family transcriptional regulator [Turicibacter sp.]|nr:GntR family transcriptional regulator [Turicibacter sp.]